MKHDKEIYYKNIKQLYIIYNKYISKWPEHRKDKFWAYMRNFWQGM